MGYLTSLSGLSGTVTGLTEALTSRASADKASLRAQGLWLACTGLVTSLGKGNTKADTWDGRLLPLAADLKSIEGAAGEEDTFVEAVVGSVSKVAVERGVYTEDSLKSGGLEWNRLPGKWLLLVTRVGVFSVTGS